MPRKPRIEDAGYYHIVNRGVEQRNIFLDDGDFYKFLEFVDEYKKLYRFKIHSYCLMDNHYHLLMETTDTNLSLIMKQLNNNYTRYFNKKYNRVGTLWQGRYKSWYVYDERYLHTLMKYIEYNPIKANITKKFGEYRWASSCTLGEAVLDSKEIDDISVFLQYKVTKARWRNKKS
jgi:REP element-mobilizing transposase RayT